jgi:hypothetical protein
VRWQLVPESLEQLREALLARGEAPPMSLSHGSLPPPGGSAQEAALLRRSMPPIWQSTRACQRAAETFDVTRPGQR